MKNFILLQFVFCLLLQTLVFGQPDLGEERIEPLSFPKFTVGGEYALLRRMRAFNGSDFKRSLNDTFGVNLHAEAGLIKYLNAGLSVSFTKSTPFLEGSNIFRMGLFIKPYLPIGSRMSIFSRFGLGPSISFGTEALAYKLLAHLGGNKKPQGFDEFVHTYGLTTYWPLAAGLNGSATLGVEAFLTSRIAIVLETGIRGDMLWARIVNDEKLRKVDMQPLSGNPPPDWFHYLIYDMPIMLSMHIIL